MIIAVHRTPGEISTIREENAAQSDLEDLRPYEIYESGLRALGGEGITRWVKLTVGNMTIAYARVMDKDHSPPRTYINGLDAIFGMAQLGFPHGPTKLDSPGRRPPGEGALGRRRQPRSMDSLALAASHANVAFLCTPSTASRHWTQAFPPRRVGNTRDARVEPLPSSRYPARHLRSSHERARERPLADASPGAGKSGKLAPEARRPGIRTKMHHLARKGIQHGKRGAISERPLPAVGTISYELGLHF